MSELIAQKARSYASLLAEPLAENKYGRYVAEVAKVVAYYRVLGTLEALGEHQKAGKEKPKADTLEPATPAECALLLGRQANLDLSEDELQLFGHSCLKMEEPLMRPGLSPLRLADLPWRTKRKAIGDYPQNPCALMEILSLPVVAIARSAVREAVLWGLDDHEMFLPQVKAAPRWDAVTPELQCLQQHRNKKIVAIEAISATGKTRAALALALSNHPRQVIFLASRTAIAHSLYLTIQDDLKALGCESLSVEVYYGGQCQECTHDKIHPLSADIVVISADAILNRTGASFESLTAVSLFTGALVIDEYHEFQHIGALFARLQEIIEARLQVSKHPTIALSATLGPGLAALLHIGENGLGNSDCVLIQSAIGRFENRFTLHLHDELISTYLMHLSPKAFAESTAIIVPTVPATQLLWLKMQEKSTNLNLILAHAQYTASDKEKLYRILDEAFLPENATKKSVISSPLIECSVNYDFQKIVATVVSPESSVQLAARCNRFNRRKSGSLHFTLSMPPSSANKSVNKTAIALRVRWIEQLKTSFPLAIRPSGSDVSLRQLYEIYLKFCRVNKKEIISYVGSVYVHAKEKLLEFEKIAQKSQWEPQKLDITEEMWLYSHNVSVLDREAKEGGSRAFRRGFRGSSVFVTCAVKSGFGKNCVDTGDLLSVSDAVTIPLPHAVYLATSLSEKSSVFLKNIEKLSSLGERFGFKWSTSKRYWEDPSAIVRLSKYSETALLLSAPETGVRNYQKLFFSTIPENIWRFYHRNGNERGLGLVSQKVLHAIEFGVKNLAE
jgi:hypothetical protein